ncbi:MAG: rhomboid family intramembrane serine protease [Solirubrobacterales bacterium]
MSTSEPSSELGVVCHSCGEEVSAFVTECPYCGTRLRKRAPKLERQGDEIVAHEPRRQKRRRQRAERRQAAPSGRPGPLARGVSWAAERPIVTLAAIIGPATLLLVQRAADLGPANVGALVPVIGTESWRYLTAPWVFDDVGYLFVVAFALALFVPPLESRLGVVATAILLLATGSLGMLAADGLSSAGIDEPLFAAGGNGVALGAVGAWYALKRGDARRRAGELDFDSIGVAVVAVVLLALPLVETWASPVAAVAGGLVGLAAGAIATLSGRAAEA